MSFIFNSLAKDLWGKVLKLNVLRPIEDGEKYFENNWFSFLIWRGRTYEAPTEIFLPHYFSLTNTWIITEKKVVKASKVFGFSPRNSRNEVLIKEDMIGEKDGGKRLYVWDDKDPKETMDTLQFTLAVQMNKESSYSRKELLNIQKLIIKRLKEGKSPIYFNTRRLKVEEPKSVKRGWLSPHLSAGSKY